MNEIAIKTSSKNKGVLHLLFNDVLDALNDTRSSDEIKSHNFEKDLYNRYFINSLEAYGFQPKIYLLKITNYKDIIRQQIGDPSANEIILHLCDGSEVDGFLGSSVPQFLEEEGYLFSGSTANFSKICTDKHSMKDHFFKSGVPTSPYINISEWSEDIEIQIQEKKMNYPLFVKVANSYGSIGLSRESIVNNFEDVRRQVKIILKQYGKVVLEEFILGTEFSVLIFEESNEIKAYPPIYKTFFYEDPLDKWLSFKTVWEDYKWAYILSPTQDRKLEEKLKDISIKAFKSCGGNSFGRIDLRMRDKTGEIFVLEVNDTCGLGPGTTSEFILNSAGKTTEEFIEILVKSAKRMKKII